MKASEIELGKVYFSCTSQDWQFASWGVKKVRITKADHAYWTRDRVTKEYVQSSKGFRSARGIVVEVLHESTGAVVETTVVPLASIKGLWDVVAPVVVSNRAARQKAEAEAAAYRSAAYDAAWKNRQRAQELGLKGVTTNGTKNEVSPETLAMLLDMWAAHRDA